MARKLNSTLIPLRKSLQGSLLAIILALAIPGAAHARLSAKEILCRKAGDYAGEAYHSWEFAYKRYKRFKQCDDGYVAEGFANSISGLLINHWAQLDRLSEIAKEDPGFEDFVVGHISAVIPVDELNIIAKNAATNCKGEKRLCKIIHKNAVFAIADAETPR